jgi:hypothetical protein
MPPATPPAIRVHPGWRRGSNGRVVERIKGNDSEPRSSGVLEYLMEIARCRRPRSFSGTLDLFFLASSSASGRVAADYAYRERCGPREETKRTVPANALNHALPLKEDNVVTRAGGRDYGTVRSSRISPSYFPVSGALIGSASFCPLSVSRFPMLIRFSVL